MSIKSLLISLPLLTAACGTHTKKPPQASPNTSSTETITLNETYPGVVEFKRGVPVWEGVEHSPLLVEEKSYRVESETYQCRLLRLLANVTLSYGTASVTCITLVGSPSTGIDADNAGLFIRDLSRFEGQITCRDSCIIKTETPVEDFKMKLNGKFIVELVEKKVQSQREGLVYPGVEEFRVGEPTTWDGFSPGHGKTGLRLSGPGREKQWKAEELEIGFGATITWHRFSLLANKLSGSYTSHIDADNVEIVTKDVSQYWGKITCREKCVIKTQTPAKRFHMTLQGSFIVELIDHSYSLQENEFGVSRS